MKEYQVGWPRQRAKQKELWRTLVERCHANATWGKERIVGFPSMSPHKFGIRAFNLFQAQHTNAMLTHTRGDGEKGFDGVKDLEREVIMMLADLMGAHLETTAEAWPWNVDGYVTSGGTEANLMGLWIGREKLLADYPYQADKRVAVLASAASHYSLWKACNVLGLGEGTWHTCSVCENWTALPTKAAHHFVPATAGSGLHLVRARESGAIDLTDLEYLIRMLKDRGIRRFIIFLNEGTTLTGALDDTAGVGDLVQLLRGEFGEEYGFYVHVDAAYGGMIYPFIEPERVLPFRIPEVDSLTVDPYKMGQCPIAEGVFLCRRGYQRYIERRTGYVQDEVDDTLIGSRSGAYAASCWAVFSALGTEGYKEMHLESFRKAEVLHRALSEVDGIKVLAQQLNMVAFTLPEMSQERLVSFLENVVNPYHVMWSWLNFDSQNPNSHPVRIVKCNLTKDVREKWAREFARAVEKNIQ